MADTEDYAYGDDQDSLPEPSATPMVGAAALTPDVDVHVHAQDLLATNNNRRRDPTGDQALMGANHDDGNVEGLEARDENGELVREEFLKFLQNLYVKRLVILSRLAMHQHSHLFPKLVFLLFHSLVFIQWYCCILYCCAHKFQSTTCASRR